MRATDSKRSLSGNPIVHLLLIAIIGFLAYSNTFNVPFEFDDRFLIVGNPIIQNFNYFIEPSKAKIWGDFYYKTFISRYIGFLTFSFDYAIHGLDVVGYHIFNLTVHVLNAALVYWLVMLTLRVLKYHSVKVSEYQSSEDSDTMTLGHSDTHLVALFSALIFVSHPIQTEAVTYIWQRVASLATLFYLLSLVMYIKFRLHDTKKMHDAGYTIHDKKNPTACIMDRESCIVSRASCIMYLASLFSAVLAMKTKEIAFTLPIIIGLYEFMFFTDSRFTIHDSRLKRRILYLIPFFLTMLIIPLSLIENKSVSGIITDIHKTAGTAAVPLRDYLLTELRVMVTYIRLFFLPINETLDYDYPIYHSFLNREVFLSFLFLLMILGFGIYLWLKDFKVQRFKNVKNPAAETAGRQTAKEDTLWQRPQGVLLNLNDQPSTFKLFHLKLISFGIFWFFITSSVETIFIPISPDLVSMTGIPAVDVIFDHRIYLPSIGIIIASSITLFHAFMHRGEAEGRSASELIPMHTAEPVLPGGSPVGVKQCGGTAKRKNGSFSFPTIRPCLLATIIIALSIATYQRNALWGNEISFWEDVVRKSPLKARDHNNLGNTYYDKGLNGNAIEQYQTAVRLQSDWVIPHFNLGQIYFFRGEMEKARSEFEITLQINPQYYEAQRFLNYITKQYRGQIN